MSERINTSLDSDEGAPVSTPDPVDREYVAYYANMLAGTNRTDRFVIEVDEMTDGPEATARDRLKKNEELIKVEECKPRRYRAMIEVKKLYRAFFDEDCFDEALAKIQDDIDNFQDGQWEDRNYDEAKLLSLEEEVD